MAPAMLTALALGAATWLAAAAHARHPAPERIVVRGATLISDDGLRPAMSIVVEDGVVAAIVPDGDPVAALRPGDTPFDARGDVVAPGLIEWRTTEAPSHAELARATFGGVLVVVAPCDAEAIAWRRRIDATASFRAADLVAAPTGDSEALASLERLQSLPRPGAGATRGERAAWLRARTEAMAQAAGDGTRGAVEVGRRADLVFLEADPHDDLSVYDRPRQALIRGRPARRAEMETNRRFIEEALAALTRIPPPPPSRMTFEIESSGIRVGRLDAAPNGDAAREVWVPPVSTGHDWRLARRGSDDGSDWSVEGLITIGQKTRLRVEATRSAHEIRVRGWLEDGDEVVSETTIEAGADEPFFDPVTVASRRRDRLLRLAPGEVDAFDVLEILPVDQSLRMGVRRLEWRRTDAPPPGGLGPGERAFRLATPAGAEIAWVVLDPEGRPRWAALIADAGITEYRRSTQPASESMP